MLNKVSLFLFFCALSLAVPAAMAESPQQVLHMVDGSSPLILIKVRAIRASNPITPGSPLTEGAKTSYQIEIDSDLNDIAPKLRHLQFRTFRLVSKDEVLVPVKKKESIKLSDKTILNLRPIYLSDNRVGMWLKWVDSSGRGVLLDTRMHFDSEESMLAGTENHAGDGGLILAISAKPK